MSDCDCGLISEVADDTRLLCQIRRGRFVVIYENISKEDAKEYVEELRRKVMELTLPTPVFKDAAYCHNHTGHVLRCTKGRKQSVGFFTCGR